MQCVCVCEDFSKRYEFNWYDKKQQDFLDKKINERSVKSKTLSY